MTDATEGFLTLPGGRTLAYSTNGNPSSSTIILFFHGFLGLGNASDISRVLLQKDIHYIAPTLPGWGDSSPLAPGADYASTLSADMTALLKHLHPDDSSMKLYVAGGSFGTAPAQMLYGAPFDIFPPGKHLKGLLLLGAFTPFRYHRGYAKSLTWVDYMAVGPLARYLPFNIVPRLTVFVMRRKLRTQDMAETLLRRRLFDDMGEEERTVYAKWRKENNREEGQLLKDMAATVMRSVHKTWKGFLGGAAVLHSDWGFRPNALDEEHAKCPILIVTGKVDQTTSISMANWLVANYRNARLKVIPGGHLAPRFYIDEIWEEFLDHDG